MVRGSPGGLRLPGGPHPGMIKVLVGELDRFKVAVRRLYPEVPLDCASLRRDRFVRALETPIRMGTEFPGGTPPEPVLSPAQAAPMRPVARVCCFGTRAPLVLVAAGPKSKLSHARAEEGR